MSAEAGAAVASPVTAWTPPASRWQRRSGSSAASSGSRRPIPAEPEVNWRAHPYVIFNGRLFCTVKGKSEMRKIWGAAATGRPRADRVRVRQLKQQLGHRGQHPGRGRQQPGLVGSSPAASGGTTLAVRTIGGQQVVTNSAGLHPVLVRPGHLDHVEVHRILRDLLAAGQGPGHRRVRRHRHAGHHHQVRRHDAGDLRRASALHLRRGHRPRAGQGQRAQRLGRAVVRDDGLGRHPRGGRGRLALGQQDRRRLRLLISRPPSGRVVSAAVCGLPDRQAGLTSVGGCHPGMVMMAW